jgi:uncharacterized protein YabN with tetrapyrrole methylase and pyrophosphatase domain
VLSKDLIVRLAADLQEIEASVRASDTHAPPEQLIVAGTGIRIAGQLTIEAAAWIRQAERLFFSVADPVSERVIRAINEKAEALMPLYVEGKPRSETYEAMVETIMQSVRAGNMTVAVFYGHPGVFAFPSHEAIRRARAERFRARMLPAVSAEDCLFADLGIDPADAGCQSLEASDFLLRIRSIDVTQHLVLWQIGVLGEWVYRRGSYDPSAMPLLAQKLLESYPPTHEVIIYEAACLLDAGFRNTRTSIGTLSSMALTPISTLYVPPLKAPNFDLAYATRLPLPKGRSG